MTAGDCWPFRGNDNGLSRSSDHDHGAASVTLRRKDGASVIKEIDHINDGYRKLIETAPFVALVTSGPEGLDCSPKGDAPGFVRILDDKTLAIPDRPGNNASTLPEHRA
jgi:predicted pyridoxine 5'-phosphate oxidase superfamily flavin-nucleotide-binding protein